MKTNLIVVDVEADTHFPPDYSMVCFGAVIDEEHVEFTVDSVGKLYGCY
ncbi:hypothetical protein IT400_03270 [Candidatus Nomurabacteria bacterium]|jgi:hypothetical protein|nr:hypothetical protein [Candidatus Nomurabacteria bacterium]